ncbi:ABC transporter permease [Crocinitomix algicola]|uniref:ABC transporter permease n=1 Tax=Crocinitomix algicola TaxID=1740263 RepID=UPI0008332178|nr:FtsX-like permease family protein [Crocinitomix algicola]
MWLKIAWKNIIHKPLNSILCSSLVLFGVSIISLLILLQRQLEHKFEQNLNEIDIVIGAKGSPLQLVLSAIYHVDAPTGNIPINEVEQLLKDPMIEEAIPLAYGDTYKGYRVLGTDLSYLEHYDGELENGKLFNKPMEAIIGFEIAQKTGLNVGDTFVGTHGDVEQGHVHDEHPYTVCGVLKPNNSVLDYIILTNIQSVWNVHQGHHHAQQEITAVLLKCKSKIAVLSLPRMINRTTTMQAVIPGLEINRLLNMIGIGTTTLKLIALGIILMAALSVFFVMLGRLNERQHELALMRVVGFRPIQLFGLLLVEGILLVVIGFVAGIGLSRIGVYILNNSSASDFHLYLTYQLAGEELILFGITMVVGIVAAFIPAVKVMRMNVSRILMEK